LKALIGATRLFTSGVTPLEISSGKEPIAKPLLIAYFGGDFLLFCSDKHLKHNSQHENASASISLLDRGDKSKLHNKWWFTVY